MLVHNDNKDNNVFYIDSWLYGTLTLREVALVCWRMRNKSKHMNWMNLATQVACLIRSRTLKYSNTLNLQDFHCWAKVGRKRRAHISKGKRAIWCLVTWDGRVGKMFSFRDTDGTRAEGRRANYSREMSFILEGTPPLSPGVILDTNQVTDHCVTVMARHK